jgi:hypothetical protein
MITHLIDGQDLGVPRNWQDLEIEIDWLNKKESGSINVTDLSFVLEANKFIQNRILDGTTGGVGAFEGIPYNIVVGDITNPEFTFNGYLDATDDLTVLGREEIKMSLKKLQGEDWLNDNADSFSFAYLYSIGLIKDSDFIRVPYVINYVPDGVQLMIISLSAFMMTKELIENVYALSEAGADLANALTPSVGLGVVYDLGDVVLISLKLIARLAYTVAIIIAIKNLIEELFNQLMPEKRFYLGMSFKKMMEKGCNYLGLSLRSSILDDIENDVHIPIKSGSENGKPDVGYPSNGSPIYNFGDLIRTLKEWFNADYRIINGVFIFERKDFFDYPSNYVLPDFFQNQDRLLDEYTLNTNEMISNYNIIYQFDTQDQNTLDNQYGRVFQAITTPKKVKNPKLVNIKNLTQINIPFSLGVEKTSLTPVEEALKVLGNIVDKLTGVFGNGTNFKSKINERVGSLLVSSQFTSVGKVVSMNGGKLANNQRAIFDTLKLWNKYHYINSFAEYQGYHNQYYRYKNQRIPMRLQEFDLILNNNKAVDSQGNDYEIEKCVYSPEKQTAIIDYRIKRKYTDNLKVTIIQ